MKRPLSISVATTVVLAAWLSAPQSLHAADNGNAPDKTAVSAPANDLKDAGDRIRQTGHQLQADIREGLRKARAQRAALEARQAAERKQEAERARRQAIKDAAALAEAKEAKQRQALEAAQAQARKEEAERAAKQERDRQAAMRAQREQEEKLAREQQAGKAKASKGPKEKNKLGEDPQFGVDI